MSEERKLLWPWFVALVFALPLLYVASFGPACWVLDSGRVRNEGPIRTAYWPLRKVIWRVPSPVCNAVFWWAKLGCKRDKERAFLLLYDGSGK